MTGLKFAAAIVGGMAIGMTAVTTAFACVYTQHTYQSDGNGGYTFVDTATGQCRPWRHPDGGEFNVYVNERWEVQRTERVDEAEPEIAEATEIEIAETLAMVEGKLDALQASVDAIGEKPDERNS